MDDRKIIELYFARDERAIEETKTSYGRLIFSVANAILNSRSDSEECENDTYLRTWESIPPTRPTYFSAYLSKITRNLALNTLRSKSRHNPPVIQLVFEEIAEALPDTEGDLTDEIELRDAINGFLSELGKIKRRIFVKRYFYMKDIKDISREMGVPISSVKVILLRVRRELRDYLESRGIVL